MVTCGSAIYGNASRVTAQARVRGTRPACSELNYAFSAAFDLLFQDVAYHMELS